MCLAPKPPKIEPVTPVAPLEAPLPLEIPGGRGKPAGLSALRIATRSGSAAPGGPLAIPK
jgi:hypothetical protein